MPAIRYFKISFVQVYNFFVVLNSYKLEEKANEKLGDKNKVFDVLWQNGALGYLDSGSNGEEEIFFTANEYLEFLLPRNKQIYILRSCLIDALGIRNDNWDKRPVLGY